MTRRLLTDGLAPLVRALTVRAGIRPIVEEVRSQPWSSITFTGARHRFILRFDGAQAETSIRSLAEGLDYAEFDLGRYILVDIAIVDTVIGDGSATIEIEALILAND
ncbi:MAG: hypothetical protein AAGE05_05940 [Pseudomonadota bacterium]